MLLKNLIKLSLLIYEYYARSSMTPYFVMQFSSKGHFLIMFLEKLCCGISFMSEKVFGSLELKDIQ